VKPWYRMEAGSDPSVLDIHIIDYIGGWIDQTLNELFGEKITVTAKAFIDDLAKVADSVKTLRVHINSPGGDVFGALNIANALRDQRVTKGRAVETIVDGLAASAASIIAMAGSPARMSDNGLLMIHDAWTRVAGSAAEMRRVADELDKVRDATIVPTYQWHTKLDAAEIVELMAAETWMNADEAIEKGFIEEKVGGLKAAASITPAAVAKLAVPEKYRARVNALIVTPPPPPASVAAVDVLRMCREGGCIDVAENLIASGATLEQVQARVSGERESRTRAQSRESEIRALCDKAKLPDLAGTYVAGGMAVEQVRAQLTIVTAKLDKVEIDGNLNPDHGTKKKAAIDHAAIYAELNRLPKGKE
jgi:ATP-dependent protease ClpP protease subunit